MLLLLLVLLLLMVLLLAILAPDWFDKFQGDYGGNVSVAVAAPVGNVVAGSGAIVVVVDGVASCYVSSRLV
jgi:hypothetical protein